MGDFARELEAASGNNRQSLFTGEAQITTPQEAAEAFENNPDAQLDALRQQQLLGEMARQQQLSQAEGYLRSQPDMLISSRSTSAALPQAFVQDQIQSANKDAAAMGDELKQAKAAIQARIEASREIGIEASGRLQTLIDGLGDRAPKLRQAVAQAQADFDRLGDEVKAMKPDPNRLMNTMPKWAQLTVAIGAGFDTLARILGTRGGRDRGVPSLYNVVQATMQQDFQNQRQMLQARMAQLGIADKQRQFAIQRLDKLQAEQSRAAMLLTETQLASLARDAQGTAQLLDIVRAKNDLSRNRRAEVAGLVQAGRGRTETSRTPNMQKQQGLMQIEQARMQAPNQKPRNLTPAERDDDKVAVGAEKAAESLGQLAHKLHEQRKLMGSSGFWGALKEEAFSRIGFTDSAVLRNQFLVAATALAKQNTGGGGLTDDEVKRFADAGMKLLQTKPATRLAGRMQLDQLLTGVKAQARNAMSRGRTDSAVNLLTAQRRVNRILDDFERLFK